MGPGLHLLRRAGLKFLDMTERNECRECDEPACLL
jgi:hypothetical protein